MKLSCNDRHYWILVAMLLVHVATASAPALACASCGSGGEDPLILYPNEHFKSYLGLSRASGYRGIGADGAIGDSYGPEAKASDTVALGFGLNHRSFVTVTEALVESQGQGDSKRGASDPLFAARYSLVMQEMDEPWIPQIQLITGFRPAWAKSVQTTADTLEMFGSGFPEYKLGVDLWWGMQEAPPLRFGVAHIGTRSMQRTYNGMDIQPGQLSRTNVTVGYAFEPFGKVLVGATREIRAVTRVDGEVQDASDSEMNGVFGTADGKWDETSMFRLTLSRLGNWGRNRQSTQSSTVTVAWLKTWM